MTDDFSKLTKKQLIEKLKEKSTVSTGSINTESEHEQELRNIDRLSRVSNPNQIPFRETSDHKNVMLYTAVNKHVGPLHPDNAKRTMERWKRAGVQLYTTKRTPEQVEAFKQTDEWKRYEAKNIAERKVRHAQSSKGKTEQMMAEIAKVTAQAVAEAKKDGS